jgi:hypothetical protein
MADKNLEIQVKLTADTAGAQQAAAEIKRLADEANKKPFVMPIDEAGMKAREEAMKKHADVVQKSFEMPIDEAGLKAREEATRLQAESANKEAAAVAKATEAVKVHAKEVQKDTEVVKAETKAIEQVTQSATRNAAQFAAVTTTANGAAQAKKQLTDKTTQSAMGFLQLSQAVEDAQYGFRGIVNNIPGMVMSFGGGAGLAGAVSLAAVGLNVLMEHVDLFGTKAKKAQEDASDLTQEMMKKSETAYLDARATEAAAKAQEEYNAVLQQAEGHYKAVLAQAEAVARQKKEMADAEIASADADAALQVAQLQLAETRGEVSKEDAIRAREKIRTEAEARKFTAETAAEEARIAEQRKKAAAEDELARNKQIAAHNASGASWDVLRESEVKEKQANIDSIKARMEESRLTQTELAKRGANSVGLKQEQERYAEMQKALEFNEGILKRNKQKQQESGFKTGEEAEAAAKKLSEEAAASKAEASKLRQQAESGEFGLRSRGAVFQTRQAAAATTAQAQLEQEQLRQAEEKARRDAAMAKEREQVGTAGGRLAESLAQGGASSAFVGQLQSAVAQTAAGGSSEQLMQLMQTLMANLSKMDAATREKLQKLQAEVNDLAVAK